MFDWLRSLSGFGQREREKPAIHPAAHEAAGSFPPVADDQVDVSIVPPRREPVVVRGKAYHNTAAPRGKALRNKKPPKSWTSKVLSCGLRMTAGPRIANPRPNPSGSWGRLPLRQFRLCWKRLLRLTRGCGKLP